MARNTQANCLGTGRKTAKSGTSGRSVECPWCKRTVAVNYDGTIRHHVAKLRP